MNNRDTQKLLNSGEHFESISDFKWCIFNGAEINFEWKGKLYAVSSKTEKGICFSEGCYEKDGRFYNVLSHTEFRVENCLYCKTADEVLECMVGEDRLRDIISQVNVTDRTI